MPAPRVFVSHNHRDSAYCHDFVNGLRNYNVDVWFDEQNAGAGALREMVQREIASRPHFIVILSPAAVASQWVQAEIDAALELERTGKLQTFLPVIAVRCEVPLLLRRYRQIGMPDGSPLALDQAVLQTMAAIWSDGPAPAPAPIPASGTPPPATPTEPTTTGNQGVTMSGGTINAGAFAVGPNAQATQQVQATTETNPQRALAQEKLAMLLQVIKAYAIFLPQSAELTQSAETIGQEVAKPQPNRLLIQAILQGIVANAQGVPSVVTAAEALQEALATFLP
jgi:hypothetical protein